VRARRARTEPDLGLVGEVESVDCGLLERLLPDFIPVVAPLALGADGATYNVNADPFAARLAAALGAEKLVLLTDVEGVKDGGGQLIDTLTASQAEGLIASGVIGGGMIPKVQYALAALADGVRKVHIIDGRIEHALLLEIFTAAGVGTQVVSNVFADESDRTEHREEDG
jgi:acetylglutamate kinase